MPGTEAQKRRERLLRKSACICPTMLRDFRAHAAEPTVRSTATHEGPRATSDDATRPCRPEHLIIRDMLRLTLDDAVEYACGSRAYQHRQAVEWMRHDDGDNPPPWSFDWCCREIGADPGAAFDAIKSYATAAAEQAAKRRAKR